MSDYQPNKIIPGTVYKVVQLIGQGGMGTVYEVEDTTVGKRYVLKTLHAELARPQGARRAHQQGGAQSSRACRTRTSSRW